MSRNALTCLVMATAFGLAGHALAQDAATDESADRGQELVLKNCGQCHATGTTGASPNPAAPLFRDLHKRYPIDSLGEALAEGIMVGHPQMPEFKFSPEDVNAISDYLTRIQTRQGAEGDPGTSTKN